MKIATFNVNSIRSRMPVLVRWLSLAGPDVLCLQETKVRDEEFPCRELEQLGYHVAFRGEKAWNGVAILSRSPPDEVEFGLPIGTPPDQTRIMRARFRDLWVVNTYVPQGREISDPHYQYKLQWFARLREFWASRFRPDRDRVLWVGDMNVAIEPEDVHAPDQYTDHVCFHIDARRALAACRDWGFIDVYRRFHPEPGRYSFFDYRTPNAVRRGLGWRLDYIFATAPVADEAKDAWIDLEPRTWEKPSDHAPVVAVFP
ncbi:MAG: exodeoxyribonuclease III [Kiritimatiellae bacterium]|nr:exodeoxyribonuclease III [Kiritimatiellia bacterium]